MYVYMYVCRYVFTLGSAEMQLNSYRATGARVNSFMTVNKRLQVSSDQGSKYLHTSRIV